MLRFFSVALLLSVCLPLHAQDAAKPDTKPLTLTLLKPDNTPIEGAQVVQTIQTPGGTEGDGMKDTVFKTDAKGQITLDAPDPQKHAYIRITAYAPDFAVAGLLRNSADGVFHLEPATTLSGTLQDAKGKPVAGVAVRLNTVFERIGRVGTIILLSLPDTLKAAFTATTDEAGIWTIKDVPTHGTAGLQIDDPRFSHTRLQADLSAAATKIAPLNLSVSATIQGRIVDEAGKPVVGVQIYGGPDDHSGEMQKASGQTKSTKDGTFTLSGLDAGAYHVSTSDGPGDLVSQGRTKVRTVAGEVVKLPDIVLIKGALVQGVIADADGKPLEGAMVYNSNDNATTVGTSDKTGHYTMYVPFGRNGAHIYRLPEGYVYGEEGTPFNITNFEIQKGETKTLNFTVVKGLTLEGTARDENAVAVKDATLLVDGAGEPAYGQTHQGAVDADGKWSVKGLKPGKASIKSGGEWEVVSPTEVMMPTRAPVNVVLRRVTFVGIKGRVVNTEGEPIEGANIQVEILTPMGGGMSSGGSRKVTSDPQGRFSLDKVRPEQKVQSATIAKEGYKFVSGGKASKQGVGWAMTDAILQALTGSIKGRVTDAAGKAVEGVQVLAPSGGPQARVETDAAGHFEIAGLPAGDARVIAAGASGYGEASGQGDNLDIRLQPEGALVGRDVERGYALLRDSITKSPSNRYSEVQQFAAIDPDRALELAAIPGDSSPAATLSGILYTLIEADPKRAATWAPPHLDEIKSPRSRFSIEASLALAVADFNRPLFDTLAARADKDYEALQNGAQERDQRRDLTTMGQLASKRGDLDAGDYWNKALTLALRSPDNNPNGAQQGVQTNDLVQAVVTSAVPYDLDFAMFAASQLPPRDQSSALRSSVRELLQAKQYQNARNLLEKLAAMPDQNSDFYFSNSAIELIKATGKDDPAGALALARRVNYSFEKGVALALAARYQPRDEAIKLLREAATLAPESYGTRALSQIALVAHDFDPNLTREILAPELERIQAKLSGGEDVGSMYRSNVAPLAYAYGFVDPAASRFIIEAEFARQLTVPVEAYNSQLTELTRAMASLDVERALQMADALAALNKDLGAHARSEITRFLLATPDERRELFAQG